MVEMDCPWCSEPMRLALAALEAEVRCDACATEFALAPDDEELALAA